MSGLTRSPIYWISLSIIVCLFIGIVLMTTKGIKSDVKGIHSWPKSDVQYTKDGNTGLCFAWFDGRPFTVVNCDVLERVVRR